MAKLNQQIYRDAADYYLWSGPQSEYSPAERLAIGACEAIRRACAYWRTYNVYAYSEYFLGTMRHPRFVYGYNWPSYGSDTVLRESQAQRFMALHFVAEMLEAE